MVALLVFYGDAAVRTVLHMVIVGLLCALVYRGLKLRTARPRPLGQPGYYLQCQAAGPIQFPFGPHAACSCIHDHCFSPLSATRLAFGSVHTPGSTVPHGPRPALSGRCFYGMLPRRLRRRHCPLFLRVPDRRCMTPARLWIPGDFNCDNGRVGGRIRLRADRSRPESSFTKNHILLAGIS